MHNSVGKIFEEAAEHRGRVLESRVDRGLSRHQVRKDVSIHEREEVFVFFLARCCLGQVPGGAPFSQRSEQATACTNRRGRKFLRSMVRIGHGYVRGRLERAR